MKFRKLDIDMIHNNDNTGKLMFPTSIFGETRAMTLIKYGLYQLSNYI